MHLDPNKISPMPGYILLEPAKQQQKTQGGIYLPDSADDKPQGGQVIAVGEDATSDQGTIIKCPVKVGDKVVYKKWGGNEVKMKDTEYQFLKFDDILAIIK